MSGIKLEKRNRWHNHDQSWLMTLISRAKFHSVSKFITLITYLLESGLSKASKMSYSQRVSEAKKKEASQKPDWDASTTGEKKNISAEDRIASKIA